MRPEKMSASVGRQKGKLRDYGSASSASLTIGVRFFILFGVVVITTTLTRTRIVPTIVRVPSSSPPRKYPA